MEDHQLVERCRTGDVAAFEELVKRHQARAYAIAYRLLGRREDAQEVAQEAFSRAYFRLAEFRGTAQFRTWLYRILVNLATDFLRRRKPEVPENEALFQMVDTRGNPGEHLHRQELRQNIEEAINALPADLRTVILLREMEGLSYAEIALVIRRPAAALVPLVVDDLRFVKRHTQRGVKVTLPGPYLLTRAMFVSEHDAFSMHQGDVRTIRVMLQPNRLGPGVYTLGVSILGATEAAAMNQAKRYDLLGRSFQFSVNLPDSNAVLACDFFHDAEWKFEHCPSRQSASMDIST